MSLVSLLNTKQVLNHTNSLPHLPRNDNTFKNACVHSQSVLSLKSAECSSGLYVKSSDSPQSCLKMNNLVNEASELIRLLCSVGFWILKKKEMSMTTVLSTLKKSCLALSSI